MRYVVSVYELGPNIGVALLLAGGEPALVAEVTLDPLRVLPQTVREVTGMIQADVELDDEATAQDHVDRLAQQIARLRRRLDEFPGREGTDDVELMAQAAAAIRELEAL